MATPGVLSARIILCDFAQASPDGKLTLVGAGWSFTNPGPSVLGVGVLVELDHDEMSKSHTWSSSFATPTGGLSMDRAVSRSGWRAGSPPLRSPATRSGCHSRPAWP